MGKTTRVNTFLLNDEQRIDSNHDCIGCDYNLRTLHRDGTCPECGRPVIDSIQVSVYTLKLRYQWLKSAASAMLALGLGLALPGLIILTFPLALVLLKSEPGRGRRKLLQSSRFWLLLAVLGLLLLFLWTILYVLRVLPRFMTHLIDSDVIFIYILWFVLIEIAAISWTLIIKDYAKQVRCGEAILLAYLSLVFISAGMLFSSILPWLIHGTGNTTAFFLLFTPMSIAYFLTAFLYIYLSTKIRLYVRTRTSSDIYS